MNQPTGRPLAPRDGTSSETLLTGACRGFSRGLDDPLIIERVSSAAASAGRRRRTCALSPVGPMRPMQSMPRLVGLGNPASASLRGGVFVPVLGFRACVAAVALHARASRNPVTSRELAARVTAAARCARSSFLGARPALRCEMRGLVLSPIKEVQDMGTNNRPLHEVKLGRVRATIWANETKAGPRYSVVLSRRYKAPDGSWKSTESFDAGDLLNVAHATERALEFILETTPAAAGENDEG